MCMLPRGSFCFVLNQLGSTNLLGLEFHFLNTQPLWEGSHFAVQRKIVCKCSIGICPLKPGFHVIGTIAVFAAIVKKKKKKSSANAAIIWKPLSSDRSADRSDNDRWDRKSSISAIVVAAIAELVFLSDRSDRSDHMETRLYCDKSMKRFAAS